MSSATPTVATAAAAAPAAAASPLAFKPAEYDVVTPYISVASPAEVAAAMQHYREAFQAKEAIRMGTASEVFHGEVEVFGRRVMIDPMPYPAPAGFSFKTAVEMKSSPVTINVFVPDVDAVVATAVAGGCVAQGKPDDMFNGCRVGSVVDKFGQKWTFTAQKKDLTPAVLQERFNELFTRKERGASENAELAQNDTPAKSFKPSNVQAITPYLIVRGVQDALAWYTKVFSAKEEWRLCCPVDPSRPASECEVNNPGQINHALVDVCNGGKIYVGMEVSQIGMLSPHTLGNTATGLVVYVADVDSVFDQAVAAGARVLKPVADQFWGDRTATIEDPFGHRWALSTRKENVSYEEMGKRMAALFQK